MADELKTQSIDDRPAYETPRALRLRDTHAGLGYCLLDGSGDVEVCTSGTGGPSAGCGVGISDGGWCGAGSAAGSCSAGSAAAANCISGPGAP